MVAITLSSISKNHAHVRSSTWVVRIWGSVNDSGFISVVYARTVYENFSFFSGENFGYVLLDQI